MSRLAPSRAAMPGMASDRTIEALPSELLLHVLDLFPTAQLLPLAVLSRQFNALITRLIQARFTAAIGLPRHQLMLECYVPSAQFSTPSLACHYLHTPHLDAGDPLSLAQLAALYSSFRPARKEEDRWPRGKRPRDAWEARAALVALEQDLYGVGEGESQDVRLDEGEMFAQLCTTTTLLRDGPRPGFYAGAACVGDGVLRVWRDWLKIRAEAGVVALGGDDGVLWADLGKNVGVRFSVVELEAPVLRNAEEELESPVSYRLTFEEVLIRTRQLSKALEKSTAEKPPDSGTEIMIL